MLDLAHRFAGRAGRTKFLWRQRAAMCQSWLACPARVAVRAQALTLSSASLLVQGFTWLPAWYSYQRVGNSEFRFKPRRLAVTESQSSPKRSLSDLEKRGRSFDHSINFLVFGPREKDFECPGARGHVGSPWVDRGVRPWHFPHKLEGGHCIFAHIGQLQTCLTKSPHNCTFCTKGRVFGTLIILPAPLRGPSVPA